MKTEIKDIPIKTPDGTNVTVGKSIYVVKVKEVSRYRSDQARPDVLPSKSGKSRGEIETHEVISVNQSANSRSFVVRSPKGCETTYSVKDRCLPDFVFGTREAAKKYVKSLDKADIERVDKKIKSAEASVKQWRETLEEWRKVKKQLLGRSK